MILCHAAKENGGKTQENFRHLAFTRFHVAQRTIKWKCQAADSGK